MNKPAHGVTYIHPFTGEEIAVEYADLGDRLAFIGHTLFMTRDVPPERCTVHPDIYRAEQAAICKYREDQKNER